MKEQKNGKNPYANLIKKPGEAGKNAFPKPIQNVRMAKPTMRKTGRGR